MKWLIDLSKSSLKFINKNNINKKNIVSILIIAIKKLQGQNINIDIKKMSGNWEGFYRVRKGKIRILISISFEDLSIYVDKIDYRGNIYK